MNPATSRSFISHLIVFVAMVSAVVLYLARNSLNVAEVYVREDLRIDKEQLDLAFALFFFAYAAGQVPAGWLGQRFGPRLMISLFMLGWSLCVVFIAISHDYLTLLLGRFFLGLSQAGAFPTAALLIKRWVPDHSRGLASSIVSLGGRLGGAGVSALTGFMIIWFVAADTPMEITTNDILAPANFLDKAATDDGPLQPIRAAVARQFTSTPLSAESLVNVLQEMGRDPALVDRLDTSKLSLSSDAMAILARQADARSQLESARLNRLILEKSFPGQIRQIHGRGWRPTLLNYGWFGIGMAVVMWLVLRDWPRDHPWITQAERNWIETNQATNDQDSGGESIPIAELLTSRNQWIYSASHFFSNFGWIFVATQMPRFLDERFQSPLNQRGILTMIPLFLAAIALPSGGWLTDRLTHRFGRRWGRSIPLGGIRLPAAVIFAICPFLPDAWSVTFAVAAASVLHDMGIPAAWAFAQDTAGKQVGTVLGWANMWGNLGAGLALIATGRVAEQFGWTTAILMLAAAFLLCGITGMLARADLPMFPSIPDSPSKT